MHVLDVWVMVESRLRSECKWFEEAEGRDVVDMEGFDDRGREKRMEQEIFM